MLEQLLVSLQFLLPQHALSQVAGMVAESKRDWLKNFLIRGFIKRYPVNMQEALIEEPTAYESFNQFFIRALKPALRPILQDQQDIACPADGTIAQLGRITSNQLLQIKNYFFDLESLLGCKKTASLFYNGNFATIYLAPHNYHRVHMPIKGKLRQSIYVPGRLFSVNRMTTALVPGLYSRNERYIALFDTEAGPMAVILVGAMIVGSIQTVWMPRALRAKTLCIESYPQQILLDKGAELGHFKLGSTVIVLFGENQISWLENITSGTSLQFGQSIGKCFAQDKISARSP